MKTILLVTLAAVAVSGCKSGWMPSLPVTKSAEEIVDSRTPTTPRDARTRAKLHTELGALYLQDGNMQVALEELTYAITIDADYAKAYGARGVVMYYLREIALAERDFQKAMSLDGNDPELNNNYGWFLCQIGRGKEGMEYFQRAIRNPLYETPGKAYANAGACHLKLGDLVTAEGFLQNSLNLMPDNPQAKLQMALVHYRRGEFDVAAQDLQDLAGNEPNAETLWLLVRVHRQLGNRLVEARYSTQLRRRFPLSPEAQELLKGNFE
ncbi:MAG TPA: type IV pilus biogenesis/stability protein PilW [Accumulibacter sp.]|nr:type IV pilus biogenesis/stability protein PilW [Accumulibacter sp.]HMW17192.1 type IV pilus biogenesis/stability protein PilW [Accumulibacter sp.]HMX21782.1 type IV pilus biogenesis/stability protein PilW [Accumulibacter sp.]HMY05536.1 type IV pilus biogenesis/stability protein PilW [Accumulibacter sp.]HNC18286.1 type IV pilus biogenesis/stability protein PilW [Accumulibacter sp.]